MNFKKAGAKSIIELEGKLKSSYSIFYLVLFSIILLSSLALIIFWRAHPITLLAVLFIPSVLLVFLFKIILWNIFGKETLVFGKRDLRVFYDYTFIYNKTIKNYNFEQLTIKVRSNTSEDVVALETLEINEQEKMLYKLVFEMDEITYQSSFSLMPTEIKILQESIGSKKSSNKPFDEK